MKPGTYVMSPKFIRDPDRKQRLTRTVRVEGVEYHATEGGGAQKFARTVELTTSKILVSDKPLWVAGETALRDTKKWKFAPVIPL